MWHSIDDVITAIRENSPELCEVTLPEGHAITLNQLKGVISAVNANPYIKKLHFHNIHPFTYAHNSANRDYHRLFQNRLRVKEVFIQKWEVLDAVEHQTRCSAVLAHREDHHINAWRATEEKVLSPPLWTSLSWRRFSDSYFYRTVIISIREDRIPLPENVYESRFLSLFGQRGTLNLQAQISDSDSSERTIIRQLLLKKSYIKELTPRERLYLEEHLQLLPTPEPAAFEGEEHSVSDDSTSDFEDYANPPSVV